eukprot:1393563-Amorphochlora_amoeboformis.AAC.1
MTYDDVWGRMAAWVVSSRGGGRVGFVVGSRSMSSTVKKIAVLPGDGLGPDVMDEALKVLKAVEKKSGVQFQFQVVLITILSIPTPITLY